MTNPATTEPISYQDRLANEINFYKDDEQVHCLPDIFHYWSNKYLLPKFKPHGFISPDDFFVQSTIDHTLAHSDKSFFNILSVGAGNGESELVLAKQLCQRNILNFQITCLDINPHMLNRCEQSAAEAGLSQHFQTVCGDFNTWTTDCHFDVVMANQCLHHVVNLEHLFSNIQQAMVEDGVFLVSDMIGRNGHMRWPEAMTLLQPIWRGLPDRLKYNQLLKRFEPEYINHDCSSSGFEGIRAQDVLPLLIENFHFNFFIPFANLILVLIDRPFGHNFDASDPADRALIDYTHSIDETAILKGIIKPTQMVARLSKQVQPVVLDHPVLTPEFCVRKT